MGLFSSKKKTIVGLSVIDLGASKFDEYADFKRNAIVASDGHIDLYSKSLFDYKQKIRHSYSSARLENWGMLPVNSICRLSYSPHIINALSLKLDAYNDNGDYISYDQYFGTVPVENIIQRAGYLVGNETGEIREEIDRWKLKSIARQEPDKYTLYDSVDDMYYQGRRTYLYKEKDEYASNYDDRYHITITVEPLLEGENIDSYVSINYVHEWVDPDTGDDMSEDYTGNLDIRFIVQPRIEVLSSSGSQTGYFMSVPNGFDYIVNGIITNDASYKSAPLLSVKELNKGKLIEADENATQEEKDAAFKQRKLFESFGQNVDQISAYVDNGDIDDMKIGLILDLKSAANNNIIAYVAFNAIDSIVKRVNLGINDINISMDSNTSSITTDYGNGVLTSSFSSSFSSGIDESKYRGVVRYNISATSIDTNLEKNIDDMTSIYEAYYGDGSSNGVDPMVMRSKIENEYYSTEYPSDELSSAFNDLPTIRDLIDIRDKSHAMVEHVEVANPSDIDVSDIESLDGYKVNTAIKMSDTFDVEYYVKQSVEQVYGYGFNGSYTVYTVGSVDRNGNYMEYKLYGLSQTYVVDGKTFSNKPNSIDKTSFSIPVREDIMNGLSFYDFMQTYDSLMNGLAFSVQTIKIKWYQQKWFAIVLIIIIIIVTVVVTIMTAGAGAPLAAQIATFATNMVIAYAVTQVVMYVGEKLGVDPMVLDIVAFVASAIATGGASILTQPTFYLQLADAALKAQLREQQEIAEQIKKDAEEFEKEVEEKSKLMMFEGTVIQDWAVLSNINTRSYYESLGGNYVSLTVEQIHDAEEKKKYTLTPIVPMMLDGTAYLENQLGPHQEESDPTIAMSTTEKFGDTTYD